MSDLVKLVSDMLNVLVKVLTAYLEFCLEVAEVSLLLPRSGSLALQLSIHVASLQDIV